MTPQELAIISILSLILISSAFALVFPKQVIFFDKLIPNEQQIKLINNPDILFTKLGITAKTDISRARITVQAMPDCPENAPYQANVLQCFYISGFEFNDDYVSNAEISFKVPKEWIETNKYDKNALELRRYSYAWNDNGKLSNWKSLTTILEGEDNEYYSYNADSDGLYYFSIVGIKKIEKPIEIPNQITAEAVKEKPEINVPEQIEKEDSYAWISILALAVISLLVSFIPKPKEEAQTPFKELTNYIKESDKSEHELKNILNSNGWEDWQIDLAMKEAKQ